MGDAYAHWGLTTVQHFGGKNGKVFHGGLDEWQAAGQPISEEATTLPALEQKLTVNLAVHVYMAEVVSKIKKPGVQFIDTRTPAEYSGDDIRALRGGHIPGAINIPFQGTSKNCSHWRPRTGPGVNVNESERERSGIIRRQFCGDWRVGAIFRGALQQNWVDPDSEAKLAKGEVKTRDGMALKSLAQLKELYAGLDPNKDTIVYCQSGGRAAVTASVLRSLGFKKVRVFEKSWLGYGSNVFAPAEAVQFFNFDTLNGKIKSLEANVQNLTTEIRALTSGK